MRTSRVTPARWLFVVSFVGALSCWNAPPLSEDDLSSSQAGLLAHGRGVPQFRVKPILRCVEEGSSGGFVARFGYSNTALGPLLLPNGMLNRLLGNAADASTPTKFELGLRPLAFSVSFDGLPLMWSLDGEAAVAHSRSTPCLGLPDAAPQECNDDNPCTIDSWLIDRCVFQPSDALTCNDGNACNGLEACRAGVCRSGSPVVCPPPTERCRLPGVCTPLGGGCWYPPAPDGTACGVTHGACGAPAEGTCRSGFCFAPPEVSACDACESEFIHSGECEARMGCCHITDANDRALCESLFGCMMRTGCWHKDPLDCFCGSAKGVDCATAAANGACKAEVQAATKTTEPVLSGTRFYSFVYPAGFATQHLACRGQFCASCPR